MGRGLYSTQAVAESISTSYPIAKRQTSLRTKSLPIISFSFRECITVYPPTNFNPFDFGHRNCTIHRTNRTTRVQAIVNIYPHLYKSKTAEHLPSAMGPAGVGGKNPVDPNSRRANKPYNPKPKGAFAAGASDVDIVTLQWSSLSIV